MRFLLISALCLCAVDAGAQQLPDGFTLESLASVTTGTVGFDFLPDGRVLIIHKDTGAVSIWRPGDAVGQTIHTIEDLVIIGERGLMGIAVDPFWPARPYVYFYLSHNTGFGRLIMLTASGDLTDPTSDTLSMGSEYVILDDIPDTNQSHKGGTVRFDAQGRLYVSIGDDNQMCSAQDLTSLRGTILRLDVSGLPGVGAGPPAKSAITPVGNPFPGPDPVEQLVYAWGVRNPFRFDIDLPTGRLMIADVGSEEFEEINQILPADAGANFGWPLLEGVEPDNPGLTCGSGNTFTDPVYSYPRDGFAAVIGGAVYRDPGGGFGPVYDGDFFFYDFLKMFLRRLKLGPQGWELAPPVPGQPNATDWATNLGSATCFRVGADGALYFTNFRGSAGPSPGLYRIVSDAPVATPATDPGLTASVAPNPGGTGFTFRIGGERARGTMVHIYDVAGRLVSTLEAGSSVVAWSGVTDDGLAVSSGVYFYRVTDRRGRSATGKLTVVR